MSHRRTADLATWEPRLTVRLRLTLSYAGFLLFAGVVVLAGVYLVLKYGPQYRFSPSVPRSEGALPNDQERALVEVSLIILASLAVMGLVGGWFLAGRMLRPLQAITAAARYAATTGSLDRRIELPGHRDEFTELADTFDAMLDRLKRSFEEQRRFAANASHELRTPQAISKTMLEVAMADPHGQDLPELLRRLYETNQRGIDIVEALLSLSALSQGQVERRPLHLSAIVEDALDVLAPEAETAKVCLYHAISPCVIEGNEVLLQQLFLNLGQNAIRHNLRREGWLRIAVGPDPADSGRCRLVVENTGALLSPEQVRTFTEPFVRGQGRIASTGSRKAGHGLGLTLAARIAEVHGSSLELAPNPGGGLTAAATFPIVPEPRP